MLYIITALKAEAQAYVDKYKLKKNKLHSFVIFSNPKIVLIISGVGIEKARLATQTLINQYDITDEDIYLNVGICGAHKSFHIGELIECGFLAYMDKKVNLQSTSKHTLTCVNEAICEDIYDIVDMESYGFYDAVIHSPAIQSFYIIKIVSDHFEPSKVTKETAKSLLFNAINAINIIIQKEDL